MTKNNMKTLKEIQNSNSKIVLAGGVFDIIHPGHIHTLNDAKKLGDVLVVVVATDKTAIKMKKREPLHSAELRQELVSSLNMVDLCIIGDEEDIFKTVDLVKPQIIALGYDQTHQEKFITEGLQLFASFAILLNFPRHNKMKGMGQIVTWSVRDETLHCNSMIRIFKEFIKENPEIWTPKLKKELYQACRTIVEHEDAFIDLAFEMGPMEGLTAKEVKDYIRFIANRRLDQLGLEPIYDVQKNPLTWLDTMLNAVEHMNFFEGRATEYSKASTQGTWAEAFS